MTAMHPAGKLVSRHLLVLLFAAAGFSLIGLMVSEEWAQGVGAGALISLLPHSYFVCQSFRISATKDPQRAYFALMRGESGKFLLTAAMFALLFKFQPDVMVPAVFSGFLVMLITQIIGSVFLVKKLTE